MKINISLLVVAVSILMGLSRTARAQVVDPANALEARIHVPLAEGWKFIKSDPPGAQNLAFDDATWEAVRVPHTWNNLDGQDGGNNYVKAACWYRLHLAMTPDMAGKALFLKFQAANRRADVYVNGALVGTHLGGFGAFCYDVTSNFQPGINLLAVRVSNEADLTSPPLAADFTFFGGLYRPVELLALDPLHINPTDYASPGVTIHTPQITAKEATVTVHTQVQNSFSAALPATVAVRIIDSGGQVVARQQSQLTVPNGQTSAVDYSLSVPGPHLWNGRKDPYLYTVRVDVLRGGTIVDSVRQPLGIRSYVVDPKEGFILNGVSYPLHGVNRHQDRQDEGWALSDEDHMEDMALIKEMGCTGIRLSHYEHSQTFYDLCDREGIVVWAEVPVINIIGDGPAFAENAHQQLLELIRQSVNHPSICFWSMGNEVSGKNDPFTFFKTMSDISHKEDPSRLTTVAFRIRAQYVGSTDVYGQNRYYGWYDGGLADFAPWLKQQPPRMALSEYGAGASIYFHSEHPQKLDHSEEYQCIYHETYWRELKQHPEVWGTFLWAMFDFASDYRHEGDHAGRNDKGLVTYDRKTRKDAFYFYKANWSDEPMLYITSKRFNVRGAETIPVKVYSNAAEVELTVNGISLGKKTGDTGVFVWDNVRLQTGDNHVSAGAMRNGQNLADSCTWTYTPGAPAEVDIGQDDVMRAELLKGPPRTSPAPTPAPKQPAN